MKSRTLCATLTLLLFVAPLGASICESCLPSHCEMTRPAERVQPPEPPATASHGEPGAGSSCHGSAPATAEPAPGEESATTEAFRGTATGSLASLDCCAVGTAAETENTAATFAPATFEIALEEALGSDLPSADHDPSESRRPKPPRRAPSPLYTLHSAFLI